MDTALIMVGVGCIIAAIIGGGVKLVQVELGPVASLWRQMLLGIFGVILVISGLIAGGHMASGGGGSVVPAPEEPGNQVSVASTSAPANNVAPIKPATIDEPGTAPAVPPPVEAALPGKVDIFWCETEDGAADNEALARQAAAALSGTGKIGRVRVRELRASVNAQPDYQIHADIVRFDPGERPAADAIAQIASKGAGVTFAPAHALPGTPSVDYLSVFVCAPR